MSNERGTQGGHLLREPKGEDGNCRIIEGRKDKEWHEGSWEDAEATDGRAGLTGGKEGDKGRILEVGE